MTLNRMIGPASEHAMPAWIKRTAIGDILSRIGLNAAPVELHFMQPAVAGGHALSRHASAGLDEAERGYGLRI